MEDQNKLQNKGYLFPNKKKNKNTQPDLIGKVNWNGEEISISAWEKVSATGEKFLSISLSEKFVRPDSDTPVVVTTNNTQRSTNSNVQNGSNKLSNTSSHPDNDLDNLQDLFRNSDD